MIKNITIPIPEGYKIDSLDKETGEIKLAQIPKTIRERIKNFDDVLNYHNKPKEQFEKECEGLETDEVSYKRLKLIVAAYNENVRPDYTDLNQLKYEPTFNNYPSGAGFSFDGYGHWTTYSAVGARLVFLSRDNLKDAVKKFLPDYEKYLSNF